MFDTLTLGSTTAAHLCRVGRVADVDAAGRCWVETPDSDQETVEAKLTATAARQLSELVPGVPVLLVYPNGDMSAPIIVDLVPASRDLDLVAGAKNDELNDRKEIVVDGEEVMLEAKRELTLRCGRASLTLKRNGKIVLKGDYVLSYSRGTNRIKGGSVQIN